MRCNIDSKRQHVKVNQGVSNMRAHTVKHAKENIVKHAKENILEWYGLDAFEKGEARGTRIAYLLENDRFTCAVEAYEASTRHNVRRCKADS